jgi:hypothetical protein
MEDVVTSENMLRRGSDMQRERNILQELSRELVILNPATPTHTVDEKRKSTVVGVVVALRVW